MSDENKVFVPTNPYHAGPEHGLFTAFEPGSRTLPAAYQAFDVPPLQVDIVFERDVAVRMRDGVTIYTNGLRPAGAGNVPVIVAWSPYGKSHGSSPSVIGLFAMLPAGRVDARSRTMTFPWNSGVALKQIGHALRPSTRYMGPLSGGCPAR